MSSSTPPAGTPPATPPAPTPKTSWFKVRAGHDWGKFEATTASQAEAAFRKHFGMRGSDHGFETNPCDAPKKNDKGEFAEPWHSGQQK